MTEAFDDLRDFIKVCASEVALLAALRKIADHEVENITLTDAVDAMRDIARNAIARQEGGAGC